MGHTVTRLKTYTFTDIHNGIHSEAAVPQMRDKPALWNANVRQKAYRSHFLHRAEGHPELLLLLTSQTKHRINDA